ncbi:WD40 repeat domain-containing protein [Capilliphycus salinus ALCB114379]|uniref:WD40 repeat domain-containing protein n=1 Tax=Capilliphycus salinus TaxID=2768948 RepID=UPI0039A4F0E5
MKLFNSVKWKRPSLSILVSITGIFIIYIWEFIPFIQSKRKYCSHPAVESPYCNFSVIHTLEGDPTASDIAMNSDAKILVSGGEDKAIKIWDLQTGKLEKTFSSDSGVINTLAISSDGKTVITGSGDRIVRIWDITSEKPPQILKSHSGSVRDVHLSSDGNTIISHSENEVNVWDINTGQLKATLKLPYFRLKDVSLDGKTVLIQLSNSQLVAWDVPTNQQNVIPKLSNLSIARLSLDGQKVVGIKRTGKRNFQLKVFDIKTQEFKAKQRFSRHLFRINNITFSENVAIGKTPKGLTVWNLETAQLEATLNQKNLEDLNREDFSHLVVSPDGKILAGITGKDYLKNTKIIVLQRP